MLPEFETGDNNFAGLYFSIQSGNFYNYPPELQKHILETENSLLKKKSSAAYLEQLVHSHPGVPEYKILLSLVYDKQGRNSRSIETVLQTVDEHPGYLAGRFYMGLHCVLNDEFEKVQQLFKGFVELREIIPGRTEFLATEEEDYLMMGILYFASVRNIQPATERLKALMSRNPDYPLLELAERIVDHARMNRSTELFEEWEPKRRTVEYVDRTLSQVIYLPAFENPEVWQFYHKELSFDEWETNCFLDLPRESFIRDLEKVILDARQRHQHFFNSDIDQSYTENADISFLIHAILFLTECKSEKSLPAILGLLEDDESFYYDWFDDYFEELLIPALYHLGQHQLEVLKKFMFIPNLAFSPREVVPDAVANIAMHQPERRSEVITWFNEVFQYFIDHRDDDRLIDTDLIGCMVTCCTRLKAGELRETIKTMFGHDLVSIDFCGPFEDVESDLSGLISEEDIQPFLSIFDQYDFFRSELEALFEEDDEDEQDYDPAFFTPPIRQSSGSSARSASEKPPMPVVAVKTPGRNDPCPCGSGKKYKKCCLKS